MGMYAESLMPLIEELKKHVCKQLRQIFYADDAAAAGTLEKIKHWWLLLQNIGPMYGYHPKPSKTWLIVMLFVYTRTAWVRVGRPELGYFLPVTHLIVTVLYIISRAWAKGNRLPGCSLYSTLLYGLPKTIEWSTILFRQD